MAWIRKISTDRVITRRERVLIALEHREPDRVPVDLGAMDSTGISGIAYHRFKEFLGIAGGKIQIYDPYQQIAKVEDSVLESIGADCKPVLFDAREYREGALPDGIPCEFPAKWRPQSRPDGSEVVLDEEGRVVAARPASGFYFEWLDHPLEDAESVAEIEKRTGIFEGFDWPSFWDCDLEDMARVAKELYEKTDYLIFGNFPCHVFMGGQLLRGFETFFIDLLQRPAMAECVMENLVKAFTARFDRYAETVGPYVQVINVNDDLGTQQAPQISPTLYRKMVKPYQAMLYKHIKSKWPGYLFIHSDGAISPLIPDLIEIGIDILNPVQYTAQDMDPGQLKRRFGQELTFWGGGCDTQNILPRGTPDQVKEEVRRRIEQLAPGGGFVFCQVHNIQADVPPENIAAMYETVSEYGGYGN